MMLQIVDAVLEYLDERAAARGADANKPSLIEERAMKEEAQKKKQAEKDAKAERDKIAEQEERAEAERQQTRKYLNQAQAQQNTRQEAEAVSDEEDTLGSTNDHFRAFSDKMIVRDEFGRPGKFRKVAGMVLLLKNGNTSLYTVRPIFEVGQDFDVALALKEIIWTNPNPNSTEGSQLLTKLESDLGKLIPSQDRPRHNSVAEVYALKIQDLPIDPLSEKESRSFRIDILMEYASKGSLDDLLESVGRLSISVVRSWTLQLLDGLKELHQNGIVHRRIHPKNVLLFRPAGGGNTIIKFADPGISYRLHALQNYQDGVEDPAPSEKDLWVAPELVSSRIPTKKTDIWDLGVLVVQMLYGLEVRDRHSSPSSVLNKERVPVALRTFLSKMFIRSHNERLSAFDLLPMEFLRQGASTYDDAISDNETMPTHMSPMKRRRGSGPAGPIGRYAMEWDEIQRVGRGGFGEVVKARNKFDGQIYAIKKVLEKSSNQIDAVLKEVLLLSQLNHPNIVRYYSTWMEQGDKQIIGTERFSEDEEIDYSIEEHDTEELYADYGGARVDFISSKADGIEFGYDSDYESKYENAVGDNSDEEPDDSDKGNTKYRGSDDEDEESDSDEDSGEDSSDDEEPRELEIKSLQMRETNRMDTGFKPDEVDSGTDEPDSGATQHRKQTQTPQIPMILYIQMEYCDKQTLRDYIERGLHMNPTEYWKLLSQILEGLDYIHKKGIIHRDLKPENIFLSQTNMPRIGDFGLAANVGAHRPKSSHAPVTNRIEDAGESLNLTTGVGTRLYVAPEVLKNRSYSTKVDMYSLGIIFFEMCTQPPKTYAEQMEQISGLRSDEIKMPSCLDPDVKEREIGIIRRLLSRKPSERPDAAEILGDHSIPLANTDKDFIKALESLDDPVAKETRKTIVLRKFFSEDQKRANDPFFDSKHPKEGFQVEQLVVDMHVKDTLLAVFRRHGAVEVTKNFLVPDSEYYAEKDALRLMNEKGSLVQLRYDQVLPNARLLAIQDQFYPKSYSFGIVFRENSVDRFGQPNMYGEVVFDIVSKSEKDSDLKEAETIKVVDEIIDSFSFFQGAAMVFTINHSDILNLVLDYCNIKVVADRHVIVKELSRLSTTGNKWETLQRELKTARANISTATLAELRRFDWKDDFEKGYKKLKNIMSSYKAFSTCAKAFDNLRVVFGYLKKFRIQRKTYFSPLCMYDEQYYRGGLAFICASEGLSSRQVLATGGRYDDLIKASRPISTPSNVGITHAVGFKLTFDSLSRAILNHQKNKTGKGKARPRVHLEDQDTIATRRCDVVITASTEEDLRVHGVAIAASLWSDNVRAELDPKPPGSSTMLYTEHEYGWQILIKSTITTHNTVKVRNLKTGEESDIEINSLLYYFATEIADTRKKEVAAIEKGKGRRLSNSQDALLPGGRRGTAGEEGEMTFILPLDRKGAKKPNRPAVMDNARSKVAGFAGGNSKKAPIIVVDVQKGVFEAIRLSQLQGPEGWKRVLQATNNSQEKPYLQDIQQKVLEMAQKNKSSGTIGGTCCYIYNTRTDTCIFYYLS
ncbi:hypothetical protein ABW19_dt0206494 [Dactylella cylindrospora]|nr:hypothetical protein ABW19_dt0206494 [Dactylella cylindrospora]